MLKDLKQSTVDGALIEQSLPTFKEPELIFLLMEGSLTKKHIKILPDRVGEIIKNETI